VEPNLESVRNGAYPLSRPFFLYVNQAPKSKFDPVLLEFLKYVNSRRGQETVSNAKVYPLSGTKVAENLALLSRGTVTASVPAIPN
jgi:phosphate transport system substrate-binding protein